MKLKRTSPVEMFATVQDFWGARPGVLHGRDLSPERFFVVPRYNAVIRADPKAVRNFFSYMSLGGSKRAAVLNPLLQAACRSEWALKALIKGGYVHGFIDSSAYPGVRWSAVDALVAEWQFVACFSLTEGLVTHCLAHPKYARCLHNEVEARREATGVVRVPDLKESHVTWPSGYTESIVLGGKKVPKGSTYFARAQVMMLRLYAKTRKEVELHEYLKRLKALSSDRYEGNEDVASLIEQLIERVESLAGATGNDSIPLARCHGDLNPSQVVVEGGEPHLIDWSESEIASISHDLVYSAAFHLGWRDFGRPIAVPELETIREGLRSTLHRYPPALLVGIMLAEVGIKQYVDYNARRGTLKNWLKIVDYYFESTIPEKAAPAPTVHTG